MTVMEWILAGLAVFTALAMLVMLVALEREVNIGRREVARFPMFAVRDRLVLLVAQSAMSETEPAWLGTYSAANRLLDMSQSLDWFKHIAAFLEDLAERERDPEKQRAFEEFTKEIEAAERRVPEFACVSKEFSNALTHLLWARTYRIQHLVFWTVLIIALFVLKKRPSLTWTREKLGSPSPRDWLSPPPFSGAGAH